jgi:hypothetical protein
MSTIPLLRALGASVEPASGSTHNLQQLLLGPRAPPLLRRVFTEGFLLIRLALRLWSYLGVGESSPARGLV